MILLSKIKKILSYFVNIFIYFPLFLWNLELVFDIKANINNVIGQNIFALFLKLHPEGTNFKIEDNLPIIE